MEWREARQESRRPRRRWVETKRASLEMRYWGEVGTAFQRWWEWGEETETNRQASRRGWEVESAHEGSQSLGRERREAWNRCQLSWKAMWEREDWARRREGDLASRKAEKSGVAEGSSGDQRG